MKKTKQNKTKQKQWLKLFNTNPIQHIMIKLTSLKQLRRACREKKNNFQTTKIQNINIKAKQHSISEYLQQQLTKKQTKEKETNSFISLG